MVTVTEAVDEQLTVDGEYEMLPDVELMFM
jgi:hypothetical protein